MPYKNIVITNANVVQQQAPQQSQFYVGFSTVNPSNTNSKLYDYELIKQDLINNFNTRRRERVMKPSFGSAIWGLLMEPLTDQTAQLIQKDITDICNSDPRISPTLIKVSEYSGGYLLELTLVVNATDQSINMSVVFDQEVGLVAQ